MSTTCPDHQRGFGIIAAIVILVILAGLGAFVVSLTTSQNITLAQDVQGARAYQAARAGVEWGLGTWLTSASCTATGAPTALDGFTLTITMTPAPGTPPFCTILSTASTGSPGSMGYIERQLTAVVEGN